MRKHEKFDEMFKQIQKYIDDMPRLLNDMPAQLQQIAQKIAVLKLCWPLMESHPGVQVDIETLFDTIDSGWQLLVNINKGVEALIEYLDKLPQGLSYRNPFHNPEGG